MRAEDLGEAWARQAQLDAERGIIECRMCRRPADLDQALTLWRNGALVFAVCDRCAGGHYILLSPTDAGIEVRARRHAPVVLGGRP